MRPVRPPYATGTAAPLRLDPWLAAALALLVFALLAPFTDRDGYEGDDLNSVVPMTYLGPARAGAFLLYRYDWQPLAYELGAALWRLTGTTDAIFLLAPAAAALAIALLAGMLRPAVGLPLALGLIALAPELILSGLYYNSTILGLPLLVGAMLLASGRGHTTLLLAGLCLAGATLLRMDYILAAPALALLAAERRGDMTAMLWVAAGCVGALGFALAAGLLEPAGVIAQYRISSQEIADKAAVPGWDLRTKIMVATTLLSPAGWALSVPAALVLIIHTARSAPLRLLAWALTAAPLAMAVAAPLSPKYGLPLLPFWLLMMAAACRILLDSGGRRAALGLGALIGGAALAQLVLSVAPKPPFLAPAPHHLVQTHDGARAYGGTAWLIRDLAHAGDEATDQREARAIAARVLAGQTVEWQGGENMFDPGGTGWRRAAILLARSGARPEPVRPGLLVWRAPSGGRLILSSAQPPLSGAR